MYCSEPIWYLNESFLIILATSKGFKCFHSINVSSKFLLTNLNSKLDLLLVWCLCKSVYIDAWMSFEHYNNLKNKNEIMLSALKNVLHKILCILHWDWRIWLQQVKLQKLKSIAKYNSRALKYCPSPILSTWKKCVEARKMVFIKTKNTNTNLSFLRNFKILDRWFLLKDAHDTAYDLNNLQTFCVAKKIVENPFFYKLSEPSFENRKKNRLYFFLKS